MKVSFTATRLLGLTTLGIAAMASSALGYISYDSFESYSEAVFYGQASGDWTVSSSDLSVVTNKGAYTFSACTLPLTGTYDLEPGPGLLSAAHTQVLELSTEGETLTRTVSGADTTDVKTYVDTMVYLVPSDGTPDVTSDVTVQAAVFLNSDSNIVVFAGGPTRVDTNRFVVTDQTVAPETWVRLTILMDYETDEVTFGEVDQCFFKVQVNGSDLTSSEAYAAIPTAGETPSPVAGGIYLRAANAGDADETKMNSVALKGTGMIDDFVVTDQTPDFIGGEEEEPYVTWATALGATETGPTSNEDGDAYTLLEEYLMGTDPTASTSWAIETISVDGSGILTLTWSGVATDADAVTVQGAVTVDGTYNAVAGTISFDTDTYTFVSDASVAGLTSFVLVASDE